MSRSLFRRSRNVKDFKAERLRVEENELRY